MTTTLDTLLNHVSVRALTPQALSSEQIHQLVTAAQAAPTASFQQSYSIIGVTDPDLRQQIAGYAGGQRFVATGGTLFIFCADLHRIQYLAQEQGVDLTETLTGIDATLAGTVDATLAAQNMAIAAESMELGTCYSGGIRDGIVDIAPLLDIPENVFPVLGLVIGYPQSRNALKPRLPFAAVYHENRYQSSESAILHHYDDQTNQYYAQRTGKTSPTTRRWSHTAIDSFRQHPRTFMQKFLNDHGLAKH
ncbi:NADPH-dependent oxidoreductase [Levilactobacillus acidifarinae]|uniref:Nadph-fmn oxidoreductase n=1 Tax=Levilactobacillus acidifarinae DSM 19394 = JCM 15949 TaxID=1423715 RepID=A0A0R1LUN6_9LACO|nr:NADPH-dependent oxidoreductase [Levilactobacillus acidifarinae]KRK95970.1 nadph-fmn oxidoreductase [Levilactobacillus acidifarinae DSM 19394]GEO69275.1 FMN reductase (NADPH) [Levilactobacillus acidifarinae]